LAYVETPASHLRLLEAYNSISYSKARIKEGKRYLAIIQIHNFKILKIFAKRGRVVLYNLYIYLKITLMIFFYFILKFIFISSSSSSAHYIPLLNIGLSNFSPSRSIFDYSHPAPATTFIITSLLMSPLLGHSPSLWITQKKNGP
jgi:hypothetical protein